MSDHEPEHAHRWDPETRTCGCGAVAPPWLVTVWERYAEGRDG